MEKAEKFSDLKREQKEAIGLLSVGSFLEYFDLMLYVHMAVFLNELFFKPTNDPDTAALFSAAAFCSTFVFRPLGGYIFGRLGDTIGRKSTVIITTFMMAASCVIIATLPPYAQIGVTASWAITVCRILQGMSSAGEIIGAQLYLTECLKPPIQYPVVSFMSNATGIGSTVALGFASLVTSFGYNWRNAFWLGAVVAVVGTVARTTLRETPDFADANRRIKKIHEQANIDSDTLKDSVFLKEKVNKKTTIYLFLLNCSWPVCFYFAYVYCGNILKSSFGYSAEEIIHHNFLLAMAGLVFGLIISYLSYYIYPLKILKVKLFFLLLYITCLPYLLGNITTPTQLLVFQMLILSVSGGTSPAVSIFYKHIPVFKRFTYASVTYTLSRTLMYIVTSFGVVYLIKYCGYYGLAILLIPISILGMMAVNHFENWKRQPVGIQRRKKIWKSH